MKRIFLNVVLTGLVLISASFVRADINDDIATIKKMEQDLNTFTDTSIFEKMTTPEWVIQDATGITNKVDFIKSIKAGDVHLTFVLNAIDVRVYGDSAIATYSDNRTGTFKGVDVSGYYMDSDMFVRQNGTWKSVYSTDFKASDENQDIAAITKFENNLGAAILNNDAATCEKIIAPEWTYDDEGGRITKDFLIDQMKTGKVKFTAWLIEGLVIKVYGNSASVKYITTQKGFWDGHDLTGRYSNLDMLIKKDNKWVAVSSENAKLSDKQ